MNEYKSFTTFSNFNFWSTKECTILNSSLTNCNLKSKNLTPISNWEEIGISWHFPATSAIECKAPESCVPGSDKSKT